jgi:hypothetical protein
MLARIGTGLGFCLCGYVRGNASHGAARSRSGGVKERIAG